MFDISKIRPKSILGPVKAQKFSRCLKVYHANHLDMVSSVQVKIYPSDLQMQPLIGLPTFTSVANDLNDALRLVNELSAWAATCWSQSVTKVITKAIGLHISL